MSDPKQAGDEGQSFYNEALTGSGTINEDGTYGPPEPDPTLKRGGVKDGSTTDGGVKRQSTTDTAKRTAKK